MTKRLIVPLALGVLLLAGCLPAITAADLVGTWQVPGEHATPGGELYLRLTDGGTFQMAASPAELDTAPLVEGEWTFRGARLTLTDRSAAVGWDQCRGEPAGLYGVELPDVESMVLRLLEDGCADRAGRLTAGPLIWVPEGQGGGSQPGAGDIQ
ncbi:MAG: hypothetical protein Kow00124_26450 [Anaerolineae bacterium]